MTAFNEMLAHALVHRALRMLRARTSRVFLPKETDRRQLRPLPEKLVVACVTEGP